MTDPAARFLGGSSIAAAFDFARAFRRPALRDRMKEIGFDGATDAVVAYGPHETRDQAAARVEGDGRRVLLAGADPDEVCGWRLDWRAS